tara:strand:+ start:484 stop:747 length:264 start_codon:yes stop_codon:yes gene_type:complete
MPKVENFFQSVPDLNILTFGSKYFKVGKADIALTKNQNIFLKTPSNIDPKDREITQQFINNIIDYLVNEGFVPKAKDKKKVHVWVYN